MPLTVIDGVNSIIAAAYSASDAIGVPEKVHPLFVAPVLHGPRGLGGMSPSGSSSSSGVASTGAVTGNVEAALSGVKWSCPSSRD